MCKFNSRLFVFLVVVSLLILVVAARPAPPDRSLIDLLIDGNDYDLRYDQRQKGGENVRVRLDGIFVGLPADPSSLVVMTDELINVLGEELLLARNGEAGGDPNAAVQPQVPPSDFEVQQPAGGARLSDGDVGGVVAEKSAPERRDKLSQGSRTKVYILNLLDYVRRNQRI